MGSERNSALMSSMMRASARSIDRTPHYDDRCVMAFAERQMLFITFTIIIWNRLIRIRRHTELKYIHEIINTFIHNQRARAIHLSFTITYISPPVFCCLFTIILTVELCTKFHFSFYTTSYIFLVTYTVVLLVLDISMCRRSNENNK